MASSKTGDFVNEWNSRLKLGIQYRKRYSTIDRWDTYREMYRGNFSKEIDIPINRIFSTGKSLIPRIYFKTPAITVTPRRPEFALHSRVVEALDNWLIPELNLKAEIKRAILDTYLCGTGPLKLGYDSEFGYVPFTIVDRDQGTVTQVGQQDGQKIEYRENIKPGMPWACRTKPEEVITPYGISNPKAFPWVGNYILRPLRDVQQDQKYNSKKKDLKGGFIPSSLDGTLNIFNKDFEKFDIPHVLLTEIRDFRTGRIYIMAEDQVLLDEMDELQVEGLPWEFLIFNEDPEHFWGIPDVKMIHAQQKELNEIKTQTSRLRKLNLVKFLYKVGVFEKEDIDKLTSDDIEDIAAAIGVKDDALGSSILPFQPHNLTAELIRDSQAVEGDMRETIGFSRNQLGEYTPQHNKTATEAEIVNRAVETRIDEKRDQLADIISNIIRKWNQYIFKFWDTPHIIEIVGNQGERGWVEYTGEQLKGEYFLKIDPETGLPVSRGMRQESAKELFKLFNNDPLIDQIFLRKMVLRQNDWIDSTAELLVREPMGNMTPPGEGTPGQNGEIPMAGIGQSLPPQLMQSSPEKAIPFPEMLKMMGGGR